MRVLVVTTEPGAGVSVLEPEDLRRLHVETDAGANGAVSVVLEQAGAGRLEGDAAWLEIEFLRRSGRPADSKWNTSFDSMIQFARQHGWLSPDELHVRAHIEPKAPEGSP